MGYIDGVDETMLFADKYVSVKYVRSSMRKRNEALSALLELSNTVRYGGSPGRIGRAIISTALFWRGCGIFRSCRLATKKARLVYDP